MMDVYIVGYNELSEFEHLWNVSPKMYGRLDT